MVKKLATAICVLTSILHAPANAELHGRLPATAGGTDFRAYYDDVSNLTWLKDSNLPWTLQGQHLFWDDAVALGNNLSIGGISGWRLPLIDRNGDGVIVRCGPRYPDVTLEECEDNEFDAMIVSNGFWANGVFDANGNGRIDEGEVTGDMGPFENFHPRLDFWSSNPGQTDQFGNEYAIFYIPPAVDPDVQPNSYTSGSGNKLVDSFNMQSWYVRTGDVLVEVCDNGIDDNGDGLVDGDDPDCQEICDNGLDDDGDGQVDDQDPDCLQPLVRCHHTPIYAAGSGEILTIQANAIAEDGSELIVDEIEIWLGFNKDAPQEIAANVSGTSLEYPPAGDRFSYACVARNGSRSHFSGWRTVALGDFPFFAIPVVLNGRMHDKIDIVFVADQDEYTSFADPSFLDDVGLLVSEGYGTVPWFVEYQDYFNFWIARDMGNTGPDPEPDAAFCLREGPDNWRISYAFADVGALIHRSNCRDRASAARRLFTTEVQLDRLQVVVHETGHAPFGLADEYCCNTRYYSNPPSPNLLDTEVECQIEALARGFDPSNCRVLESTSNQTSAWIFEPNYQSSTPQPNDLMQQAGCSTFGNNTACSLQMIPDLIGAEENPNGVYGCDEAMTSYRGDADGVPNDSDEYWLCLTPGTAADAVWQASSDNLDRYDAGASEMDRMFWFIGQCDGGNC